MRLQTLKCAILLFGLVAVGAALGQTNSAKP